MLKVLVFCLQVNTGDLDPKFVYIQVTHVTPYFDEKELLERQTDFERNNNLRRFMFETPFTKDGKAHGEIENQWRRRTIITSKYCGYIVAIGRSLPVCIVVILSPQDDHNLCVLWLYYHSVLLKETWDYHN